MPCFRYTSYFLKYITKVLGITWELRGGEHLAEDRGCVIVANHQSMLDILGEKAFSFITESLVDH
jgi:lysophosphatidate acyltransferase